MMDTKTAIRELLNTSCRCGNEKKPGKSLCYTCFRKLPREMGRNLYRLSGEGYEEAYGAAVGWLFNLDKQEGA